MSAAVWVRRVGYPLTFASASACAANPPSDSQDTAEKCSKGDEGCACYADSSCNGNLTCYSKVCVDDPAADDEQGDSEAATTSQGSDDAPSPDGMSDATDDGADESDATDMASPDPTTEQSNSPGADTPPAECSASNLLTMDASGEVLAACNDSAINGSWYCFDDGVNTSSCNPETPPFRAGEMCLSGQTSLDPTYAAWGALVAVSLNQPADGNAGPYDAEAQRLLGFRITLSGDFGGNLVRVAFKGAAPGLAPFVEFSSPTTADVLIADAEVPSGWDVPEAGSRPDPNALYELQISVVGAERNASYDFCVSRVQTLREADTMDPSPPDDGTSSDPDAPECRTYATAYSINSRSAYTCTHSEASGFDRICTIQNTTVTEHWASKSDFIDEARAPGVSKLLSRVQDAPDSVTEYAYDAQGRQHTITLDGEVYATYDDWDELGRPLHGVLWGTCDEAEVVYSYGADTATYDVASGSCKHHSVSTFDADMIRISDVMDIGTNTYTTESRETVCR